MKKWIIRIILAIMVIGAFAGVGFAGYRLGLSQGAQLSGNFDDAPRFVERFHKDAISGLPFEFHKDDRAFQRGFALGGLHRGSAGFLSPLFLLVKVAVLGFIAWGIYKLFSGNGWQLSFTRQPAETPPVQHSETPAATKPKGKQ